MASAQPHQPQAITDEVLYDSATLWDLVERRAVATPDSPMLLEGIDRQLTFREFRDWAERVAAELYSQGVGENSVVAWQFPTRIETVVLTMALSRLGAVQVPIISAYREREVSSLLRQSSAQWFLVPSSWRDFDYARMAHAVAEDALGDLHVVVADDLPQGDPGVLPPPPADGRSVRWIYSTSGTTSEPKCVFHTDESLIAGGVALSVARLPGPREVGMTAYPYAHIGAPIQLVRMLAHGVPSLLMDKFVAEHAIELMRQHKVTSAGASTAFYLAFLDQQRKEPGGPITPSLRCLDGGGAPMPPDIFHQVHQELGIRITHGFGMTECPMIVTGMPSDSDDQLANTVGAPVRGVELEVRDQQGLPVGTGCDGDIWVRGPMLFKRYANPDLTAKSFDDSGFFNTGDRGHVRADGHYVLTGRTKELIIRKGENISPLEVEAVLQEHPNVGAVAVIGLPDHERGERVCAVVETERGHEALSFIEMQDHCRSRGLVVFKIPEQLEIVDELPRNATTKILKTELTQLFGDGSPSRHKEESE